MQDPGNKGKADELQLVVFTLGEDEFGVDIGSVLEIIKVVPITEVPDVPDYVEGIINLRGQIISVIDLEKKLGDKQIEETPDTRIMIVSIHDNTLGMKVDSVTEVLRISSEDVSPPPKNLATKVHQNFIKGVGKIGERLIILLNLEGILDKEETEEIAAKEDK
jgi:purine-binding chemotaxis protein CheW